MRRQLVVGLRQTRDVLTGRARWRTVLRPKGR